MGFTDFFIERKPETKVEDVAPVASSNATLGVVASDVPLREAVDGVRSEKFSNFLNHLKALEPIAGITVQARFKAAMDTSGISLPEIQQNLGQMKSQIDSGVSSFRNQVENQTLEVETRVTREMMDKGNIVAGKNDEIEKLKSDIGALDEEINLLGADLQKTKQENSQKILEYQTTALQIKLEVENLEQQIITNLK